MYKRIHGRLLFYMVTVTGLCTVGIAILASLLSHPGSGQPEAWHRFMLTFLSFFAAMGGIALGFRRVLGFPWWLGSSLLAYPLITFLTLSPEMRRYLVDSELRGRLAYTDVGRFTSLDVILFGLTFACVLASLFFLRELNTTKADA